MLGRITSLILIAELAGCAPTLAASSPESNAVLGPMRYLPGIAGDYFPLDSRVVGRRFHIFVKLPDSYQEDPGRRFPVSYLLDGDSMFPMLAPEHMFLNTDEGLPEAIIVGIAYGGFDMGVNKRHIDFRPVMEDGSAGGAAKFLELLESELLPRIDAQYRTDPTRRTLFGQSRGGSFVLYAANERPSLFHGYIASNPARENDKHLYGVGLPSSPNRTAGIVVVTTGSRDRDYQREVALEWGELVAKRTDLPWHAELVTIAEGTHAASAAQAYRAGMLRALGIEGKR